MNLEYLELNKKYYENYKICWPKLLVKVTEEYNNTPHSVTSFSPKYLLFGLKPFDCEIDSNLSLDKAREIAFINSQKNHNLNKTYYDKRHQKFIFNVNDLVLVENKNHIS